MSERCVTGGHTDGNANAKPQYEQSFGFTRRAQEKNGDSAFEVQRSLGECLGEWLCAHKDTTRQFESQWPMPYFFVLLLHLPFSLFNPFLSFFFFFFFFFFCFSLPSLPLVACAFSQRACCVC